MPQKTKHHLEHAGHHLVKKVSIANRHDTVNEVVKRLQDDNKKYDTVDYTYILSEEGILEGVISIKELLNAKNQEKLENLMKTKLFVAHPETDQEEVANIALKHNIKAIPIVDENHSFIGVVPSDVILNILHWEHNEDVLRLSGIHGQGVEYRNILKEGFFNISKIRIPALLIGLMGGLFTTQIVSFFEQSLEKEILLAFFIPVIVYMSAAVGNQTQTILIRTLATEEVNSSKYIRRELFTGSLIGIFLGSIMFLLVTLWFKSLYIAITIGISMAITIMMATVIAVSITFLLLKMKKDPAIAGGPYATVIQDILSLVIYFSVAALVLN